MTDTDEPKPTIVRGKLYRMYFESLHNRSGDKSKQQSNRVTTCIILAANPEQAIAKAHAAFPGETVNSIFRDDDRYGNSDYAHDELIVL